jgi:hypothetical protein
MDPPQYGCGYQNVTDTFANTTFSSVQYICTYPPKPKVALDFIYLILFVGIFLVGTGLMYLKYRKTQKNRTIDNSEDEEDNDGEDNE